MIRIASLALAFGVRYYSVLVRALLTDLTVSLLTL